MVRKLRPLAWFMIAFVALAGTATAGASLLGGVDASVASEDADLDAGADVAGAVDDDGNADVDAAVDASATVDEHSADVAADSDGNVEANVDDHHAAASVDVEEQSATVTVDDTTVSTDQLATDEPEVPELDGSVSFGAMVDAMVSYGDDFMASLSAAISGFFGF